MAVEEWASEVHRMTWIADPFSKATKDVVIYDLHNLRRDLGTYY